MYCSLPGTTVALRAASTSSARIAAVAIHMMSVIRVIEKSTPRTENSKIGVG
jgi:hypothetical protein